MGDEGDVDEGGAMTKRAAKRARIQKNAGRRRFRQWRIAVLGWSMRGPERRKRARRMTRYAKSPEGRAFIERVMPLVRAGFVGSSWTVERAPEVG